MVETDATSLQHLGAAGREPPFRYSLYGLNVLTDVALPTAPTSGEAQDAPDVVIRRIHSRCPPEPDGPEVASILCPVHGIEMREYRGPGGIWIWLHSAATFHITPDARRVDVYPDDQADEPNPGFALAGPILLFVRHRLGYPSLHASAIITSRGAIAFLGPRGRGKSTMAASFLRRDAALLTDDALPLQTGDDGIYAVPGPPFMKVWQETARHTLELADELPNMMADYEKKLLALDGRYKVAQTPVRLHAFYLLDRYDTAATDRTEIAIRTMGRREALATLLGHTCNRRYLLPAEDALAFPLYARLVAQAPVRVLTYPHGFEYQEAVHARLLEDLQAQ